ncbi:ABC transporter substrate-binding protein [Bradyrhizobium zhanjiangense]|uniref:Spermidine/putrescine ABC transporter substrate-binding protein n=1 Tax=Bradyrhizobium zhanjiangense TaxID=1325107 RepID=A0A4Q0RZD0_9BRAD|nr:ABC transporter substrate-binding protein [Bradyrhizobium zhanjiangense]RXH24774.1 spermidine/putrescine ABC transporter substrate-binding protein [Bradyrhizobium zhanjiangense]
MIKMLLTVASAIAGLAAGTLVPIGHTFAAEKLTITSYGGSYQAALRKAYFEPFSSESGVTVNEDEYNGEDAKIRAMVMSGSVTWDVVDGSVQTAIRMCAEGLLETIDWKRIGVDRSKLIGAQESDCLVPYVITGSVVGYDKSKLPVGPKNMADFFDLQKFPGKRGLRKSPVKTLEMALMADGVSIKDVYKVLSTSDGVDRAFRKLDTIKKDVIWYTSLAQATQLLADGEVIMVPAPIGRFYDAIKNSGKPFEIVWETQIQEVAPWLVPKGTPRLDAVYKFLAYSATPRPQVSLTHILPFSPVNRDAMAMVDPAMKPYLPTEPEHMTNTLMHDADFWLGHDDQLRQRFNVWLAK